MASVLSSDGKQDPDILAANASSAALMLSDVPWGGPIGVIRIGRICGQFVVNPTMDEVKSGILVYSLHLQIVASVLIFCIFVVVELCIA